MSKEYIYVYGDADKVRERIEYYLFNNDLRQLTNLSQSISAAIERMKNLAVSTMKAEIIIAGGDDILFKVNREEYTRAKLEKLEEIFSKDSGGTISFGVGSSLERAYINLRRAKSSRTSKIIEGNFSR